MMKVLATTLFTFMIIQNVAAGCFSCYKPNENACASIAQSHEQESPEGTIRIDGKVEYLAGHEANCYVYAKNLDSESQIIGRTDIAAAIRTGLKECNGSNQCYNGNVGHFEIRFDSS